MKRNAFSKFIGSASAALLGFFITSCERTETSDLPKTNEISQAEEDTRSIAPIRSNNLNGNQNLAEPSKNIESTNGVYARISDDRTGDYAILNSSNVLTLSNRAGNNVLSVNISKIMASSQFISMEFTQDKVLIRASGRKTILVDRQNGKTGYFVE